MIGLTDKEVIDNRKKYGSNKIFRKKNDTFVRLFLETLGDPIIKILLIALGIKIIFLLKDFDWYETIGIVIAILLASFISSISEYGSSLAFERLEEESLRIKCRVIRNGKITEILFDDVVKNDIVVLSSGDKIPADGFVISGTLLVDESSMNGEAKEIEKNINSFCYRNTSVYNGCAYMKVKEVGDNTYYGKLSLELQEKSDISPLKLKLMELAKTISKIGYFGAILVSISYLFNVIIISNNFSISLIKESITNIPLLIGYLLHALTLAVTILVVAVPEGLPMMITLVLSSNMKRMLKNNVLVRKLVGIETAGSLNILFTDKTGTLTKGKLDVIGIMDGNLNNYSDLINMPNGYKELLIDSLIYNNEAYFDKNTNSIIGGNITDRAILDFVKINKKSDVNITESLPFNSKNKYSIAIINKNNKGIKLIKGAPEVLLKYTNYFYNDLGEKKIIRNKELLLKKIDFMTKKGIRVLCLVTNNNLNDINDITNNSLVGIVFIKDEVRKESKTAIELVNNAHIQTVMVTGDNKDTAISIAKEIELIKNDNDIVLTSNELNKMDDMELKKILPNLRVISRALPQDKSRLVRVAKEMNLVVGMTGDGVNDAVALKKADVGFAMGSGTEVSKEASDIIILDNNFLSITNAILYGRTIFKSIRKFIIFQLTVNLCAVTISIIGPFIGVPVPITVIQMLWINMVMDTLAGLAFSYEPVLLEYMNELPKKKSEHIINKYMLNEILVTGFYSTIVCIFFLKSNYIHSFYRTGNNDVYLMTAFFGLFIFMGINNCFNARTNRLNIFANIIKNKVFLLVILFIIIVQIIMIYYGGSLFRTTSLNIKEFLVMLTLSLSVIPFDFIRKIILKKSKKSTGV